MLAVVDVKGGRRDLSGSSIIPGSVGQELSDFAGARGVVVSDWEHQEKVSLGCSDGASFKEATYSGRRLVDDSSTDGFVQYEAQLGIRPKASRGMGRSERQGVLGSDQDLFSANPA